MKILSLGTYPIQAPVHGGQRRTSQIGNYYAKHGIEYRYACVYSPNHYGAQEISEYDYPYAPVGGGYTIAPFTDDIGSGVFASRQTGPLAHFRRLAEQFEPDFIQLDQPFMWPLAQKLRAALGNQVEIIYSSHNVEAPLKQAILESAGVLQHLVEATFVALDALESELTSSAKLVIAVSEADAAHYRTIAPGVEVVVARNGIERPISEASRPERAENLTAGDYLYFVGSAYPPNVQGFERLVTPEGLYGFPPRPQFAICGGVVRGIASGPSYDAHKAANEDRCAMLAELSDAELLWIRQNARGALLPILSGGGSNLKTAEALVSDGWVVATPLAMRSFEEFSNDPNVIVAASAGAFREAMQDALQTPPPRVSAAALNAREGLFWDTLLEKSGVIDHLRRITNASASHGASA